MPSLLFPDDRLVTDGRTGRPARGKTGRLFLDEALTVPATIYADAAGAPGAVVADARLTTDQFGMLPLFWGPSDGRDTLWISVNGGPAWPVYAVTDNRLDAIVARIDDLEAGGGTGSGSDLVHKSGAETITGVKTFTASPVVPEPSDQTHAVRRAYVDNAVTAEAGVRAAADTALDGRVASLESAGGGVPQAYVDNADATVAADAAAALSAHAADTTGVHGIADTGALETQSGAQAKADAAQAAAIAAIPPVGTTAGTVAAGDDPRFETGGSVDQQDIDDTVAAHSADTTGVHGIADTSALVVTTDPRLTDARTPTTHAATHAAAGSDPVTVTQAQVTGLTGALAAKADLVGGVVPSSQIPAIAITAFLGTVGSQAAMLALDGQLGDWTIRSDTGTTWVITGPDPTQLADWTQMPSAGAPVVSVNGETGAVTLSPADVGALAAASNLGDLPNAGTARTNLGLGTAAVANTGTGPTNVVLGNDARLTDARTPTAHAASHGSGGGDPITLAQSQITGLSTALADKVGKGDQTINVKDHGATGDGTTDDTTAINTALAAATPGTTVVFPQPTVAYRITNALTVPAGVTVAGSGHGCEIRQATQLKPVFDVYNADGVTVRGFTLTNSPGPPASMGATFRGDSGYAYSAGVWTNSNRVTISDLRIRDFGMGIYLNGSNGTVNSDGTLRVANTVRDVEISGANHGVLFLSQSGLRIRGVYYHDGVDSSAGVNPIHGVYGTGTTTLISQDVVVSDCVTTGSTTGSAYQFKYVNTLSVANCSADTCFGLLNLIDVFDGTFTGLASRNDQTTGTAAYSLTVQTVTNYSQRLTFGDITIQMATDGRPMFVAAHKTRLSNITIVSNHTGVDTGGGYDLKLLGTDIVADGVTIQNVGSSYYRGVLAGQTGYVAGNITISGLVCQKVRQLVDFDASVTGTNVVDYNPGAQRDILTSAGTLLIDQISGTASFAISRREWTTSTTISGGATATPRPPLETVSRFVVTDTAAFTVAAPVCRPKTGLQQDVLIVNASGGTLGAITWNAAYTFRNPFQPPASGETTRVTFVYDGTTWRESLPSLPASTGVPSSRQVIAGTGLTGGGALSSDVTLNVAYGTTSTTAAAGNDARITGAVQTTRTISTTAPLSGGGDLSTNRTLTVASATTGAVGVVQLAGDLAGTATAPAIAAGAVTDAKVASGAAIAQSKIANLTTDLGNKVAKGDLVVNVKDHGALGDGSTNDTTAIQAAITAAGPGGTVFFPRGNYVFSTITLAAGQTLRGQGWYLARDAVTTFGDAAYASTTHIQGTVLRSTATSGNAVLHVNTTTHVGGRVEDLALIGPGSGTSVGVYLGQDTPSVRAVIKAQYRNVLVANFATGVAAYHLNEATFTDLAVRGCTKAISALGDVNNVTWVTLDMQRCTQGFVHETQANSAYRCLGNAFIAPICQNVTTEGFVLRGESHTLISPYFELVGTSANFIDLVDAKYCVIVAPTVHGAGTRNINVAAASQMNELRNLLTNASTFTVTNAGYGTVITGTLVGVTDTGSNTHLVDQNNATHQAPRFIAASTSQPAVQVASGILGRFGTSGPVVRSGTGSPEGSVSAPVGSFYLRSDGSAGTTVYSKESGTGNTGWTALGGGVPTSRQIIAGTGLTGGGDLTADRTLTVAYGTTSTTAARGDDARLSDARTPTTHAASHGSGGSDPVTVDQSQVTGLAAALSGKQDADADLTAIAGIDTATAGMLATDGAGWIKKTYAAVKTALGLTKADVGLGSVDNTADADKPISTATQTALDAKAPLASPTFTGTPTFADTGLNIGADVNLFRHSANVLRTNDTVFTDGTVRASSQVSGVVDIGAIGPGSRAAVRFGASGFVIWGSGTPEGSVAAPVGSLFLRSDGGAATTLYVKEGGTTGNTGWVGK